MAGIEAASLARIDVRVVTLREELSEAVALQQAIWGFGPNEMIPLRLFVVAAKIGGQVFGAFDGARMVGFCLSIPGIKRSGAAFLHSHMLGVLPEYRDRRIGRALKLAQRDEALSRGIALIEWTFDPLELKNAFFNIERLGAVVRRYVLNQYGATSSPLHGGLPTDRCVAEWWLAAPRVEAALEGATPARTTVEERIEVPASIGILRSEDPPRAREIQSAVSERFLDAFRRGLAVIGFEKSEGSGAYLLGQWHSR